MPSLFKSLFFIFFFANQLSAQEVILTISASGYTGEKVNIWIEDDLFTGHRNLVDTKVIENDKATFHFDIHQIKLLRITLNYQYGLLLVEPGTKYKVVFPVPEDNSQLSLAGTSRIQLIFNDLDSNDINYKISNFNKLVDEFILNNLSEDIRIADSSSISGTQPESTQSEFAISRFSERDMMRKMDGFRTGLDSTYRDIGEYFNNYRNFTFANIEYDLGKERRKLYFEYLENSDIGYNNVEFVKFFKTFYADFFDFYSYYPYSDKLIAAFESAQPINALINIIKGDTLTGSDEMKMLIMQKGLYDLYPNTSRWKGRIVEILEILKNENPYSEQRLIAGYMVENLLKGKKGTRAPDMEYIKADGDTLSLSDLKGKMVYIQFFASWNTSALAEMELISELRKRYGNRVEFLSISIDENVNDFTSFAEKNKAFKWEFGWIGDDAKLRNEFEIAHLPLFYLIDEQGKIISWPSLWPSTGIESVFLKTKYNRKAKKKKGYWDAPPNKSNNDG